MDINQTPAFEVKPASKVKKRNTFIIILLCVVIAFAGGGIFWGIQSFLNWKPLDEPQPPHAASQLPSSSPMSSNIPKEDEIVNFLVCGLDNSNNLTDVMMVVSYNTTQQIAKILQIPRDLYVGTKTPTGYSCKINAVYSHAPEGMRKIDALKNCLSDHLGIRIDFYTTITLEGLRDMVDGMGGVEVYIPQTLYVEDQVNFGPKIKLEKGLQVLDGRKAEGFIRHRHSYTEGDEGRIVAQRQFFLGFAKKMLAMNNTELISTVSSVYSDLGTDLTIGEMLEYAKMIRSKMSLENIEIYTLPGEAFYKNNLWYFSIHKEAYVEMYNANFSPFQEPIQAEHITAIEMANTIPDKDGGTKFSELPQ